jgi:hypothetical protein
MSSSEIALPVFLEEIDVAPQNALAADKFRASNEKAPPGRQGFLSCRG